MKIFSTEEKSIIKIIVNGTGHERNLLNFLDTPTNLGNVRLEVNKVTKTTEFFFETINRVPSGDEISNATKKQSEIVELIIRYVVLLQYLEDENLAIFFEPTKSRIDIIKFGGGAINLPSVGMSIDDSNTIALLIKYSDKQILPTNALKELVSNNYLSNDEIRYRSNSWKTILAIGVSMVLGIYGMYNNHSNSKSQNAEFQSLLKENSKNAQLISSQFAKIEIAKIPNVHSMNTIANELIKLNEKIVELHKLILQDEKSSKLIKIKPRNQGDKKCQFKF